MAERISLQCCYSERDASWPQGAAKKQFLEVLSHPGHGGVGLRVAPEYPGTGTGEKVVPNTKHEFSEAVAVPYNIGKATVQIQFYRLADSEELSGW